jgi:hypothetical protein
LFDGLPRSFAAVTSSVANRGGDLKKIVDSAAYAFTLSEHLTAMNKLKDESIDATAKNKLNGFLCNSNLQILNTPPVLHVGCHVKKKTRSKLADLG